MFVHIQTPGIYLWIIRAISLLAPAEAGLEWRREWEAEVYNRWLLWKKWETLNSHNKLDLFKRVLGSVFDVLCFQPSRASVVLVALNILVALATGFGALQQLIFDGIGDHRLQPLLLGLAAFCISVLFIISGVALLRQWQTASQLIASTGILSVLLHVYGALPPHRNMGIFSLIVGAGYGLAMVLVFKWSEKRNMVS